MKYFTILVKIFITIDNVTVSPDDERSEDSDHEELYSQADIEHIPQAGTVDDLPPKDKVGGHAKYGEKLQQEVKQVLLYATNNFCYGPICLTLGIIN